MEIKDKKFRSLMSQAGLGDIRLIKGDGYFYVVSDERDELYSTRADLTICVCHFNQQSPEAWVSDIARMLEKV